MTNLLRATQDGRDVGTGTASEAGAVAGSDVRSRQRATLPGSRDQYAL
jgi:hypothetical protein